MLKIVKKFYTDYQIVSKLLNVKFFNKLGGTYFLSDFSINFTY